MRTGDAESAVWVEADSGRSYCLVVVSKRRGRMGSKRWQRPVYRWRVEQWSGDEERESYVRATRTRTSTTYSEAMRLARRLADSLERAA